MDQLVTNIITNIPNFAVAFLMLYWQKQTIDQLMANQTKLIDRLLTYVDNDKERAQQVIASGAQSVNSVPKP